MQHTREKQDGTPKKFGKYVSFPKGWLSDPMLFFGGLMSGQELLKDSCHCIIENKVEEKGPPGIKYGIDLGTYTPL